MKKIQRCGSINKYSIEKIIELSKENDWASFWDDKLIPSLAIHIEYNMIKDGLIWKRNGYDFKSGSYFFRKDSKNIAKTNFWHADGTNADMAMIICSYPNPTEIIVPVDENDEIKVKSTIDCTDEINDMLKSGRVTIFTPEPGDYYYLPEGTIHRTNPKANEADYHLVLRVWF